MRKQRQRGQIIQKGPNKFLLRVSLGRDLETGTRLYDSKTFRGTVIEAQAELVSMQARSDTNSFLKPNSETVGTFWPRYLAEKRNISPNTRYQYKGRGDSDILPFWKDYKLLDVEPTMVSRWITWLESARQLSPRTIRYSYALFHGMFEQALLWNLVQRSPVNASLPRDPHKEMQTLTPYEVVCLLDVADRESDPLYALWSLLLQSGLRPQEALALTWADFDGRRVIVSKALTSGEDRRRVIDRTKTEDSRRTVTVNRDCANSLNAHRKRNGGRGTTLIFQTKSGGFLDMTNVRKAWKRACQGV